MLRLIGAVLALLVASLAAAHAEGTAYNDPAGRFSLNVPTGWEAQRPPMSDKLALLMAAPSVGTTGGVCIVLVSDTPETRASTQAELDQVFSQALTQEFWAAAFQAAGLNGVTIDSSGTKDQNGRKVYYVVVSVTGTSTSGEFKAKGKQVLHAIPGSLQFVNCSARAESYAELEAEFEGVFDSYVPKNGEFIVRREPEMPSVLTLYSGPGFDGVTRVVSRDTPNLPMQGWSGATFGLAVAGFGQWQVCDGLNYAGNCRLISAPAATRGVRVGSVRRYIDKRDVRGALSLAGQGAGVAYNSALARASRR